MGNDLIPLRYAAAAAVMVAVATLAVKLVRVGRGARPDLAPADGSPARGVWYNLTAAMSPRHKETARNHPWKFAAGAALHAGVAAAGWELLVLIGRPGWGATLWRWPAAGAEAVAVVAAVYLLIRRAATPALRSFSAADDYLAVTVTALWVGVTLGYGLGLVAPHTVLAAAAVFWLYLPWGKLQHLLFCPLSRVDLGRRLGRRGTFPPGR